jgi:hypothetical protein
LLVEPKGHAAITGWSIRLDANSRHAVMSSSCNEGCSARICSRVIRDASSSKTSVTRIRRSLTQGRPPHIPGVERIRSAVVNGTPTGRYGSVRRAELSRIRSCNWLRMQDLAPVPISHRLRHPRNSDLAILQTLAQSLHNRTIQLGHLDDR